MRVNVTDIHDDRAFTAYPRLQELRMRARELKAEKRRLINELAGVVSEQMKVIKRIREIIKREPQTAFSNEPHFVAFETALILVDPKRTICKKVPAGLRMKMLRAGRGLKVFDRYGRELDPWTE